MFFVCRKYLLVDPTDKEEKVMDGKMVIGMNKHREICTLQMAGDMLLMDDQVSLWFFIIWCNLKKIQVALVVVSFPIYE